MMLSLVLFSKVLSLGKIGESVLKGEPLLDLLDLLDALLDLNNNCVVVLSIANPRLLGVLQKLQPLLGLHLGVVPAKLDARNMALQELGLVRVLKDLLAFVDQILHHAPLGLQLDKGLLLPLDQLIHVLYTGGGDVSGGGEHDAVEELNMGLQLVTIGVALPVEVHHHLGLHHSWDELLVLLDQVLKKLLFLGSEVLGPLSHEDLQDLGKPFLHLSSLKILAEGMEVVPLALELGRGVDLVGHDASDGLLDILHPLSHLLVALAFS